MKSGKGKRFTWWIVALGVAVLVGGVVVFKDRIVEEWYLHKLQSGDKEEQKVAAERLAEMGSVRAVPVMMKKLRHAASFMVLFGKLLQNHMIELVPVSGEEEFTVVIEDFDGDGHNDVVVVNRSGAVSMGDTSRPPPLFLLKALWKITDTARKECVPCLVAALRDDDWGIRYLAATFLGALGPDASDAVPAMVQALEAPATDSERLAAVRAQAAWALGQIGPVADEVIRALTAASQDGDEAVRRAAADALERILGQEGDPIEH